MAENVTPLQTYIGARYIPVYQGTWDSSKTYEPLVLVTSTGDNPAIYISAQTVPAGTALTNTEYWLLYSGAGGDLGDINDQLDTINSTLTTVTGNISTLQQKDTEIEGNITTLQTSVSGNTSSIGELQTQQNAQGESITALQTEQTAQGTSISTLTTNVNTLSQQLGAEKMRKHFFCKTSENRVYTDAFPLETNSSTTQRTFNVLNFSSWLNDIIQMSGISSDFTNPTIEVLASYVKSGETPQVGQQQLYSLGTLNDLSITNKNIAYFTDLTYTLCQAFIRVSEVKSGTVNVLYIPISVIW